VVESGIDPNQVLSIDDLVTSDDVFFAATGITDGELLRGVRYGEDTVETESVVMRAKTGTIRYIRAVHNREKLSRIVG
jgi:fructose-1,6-bisphosphatase II